MYASVPGASGSAAGNIEAINPVTATVTSQVAAGSNPNQLSVSWDGSQLWVGEDGTGSVERFALPALASDLQFNLPKPSLYTIQPAMSLQAAPGSANTVAALLSDRVMIYDDATPRPVVTSNFDQIESLAWNANASRLYGSAYACELGSATQCYSLDVMEVDSAGVSPGNSYAGVFSYLSSPTGIRASFDPSTGYLYTNDGRVLDPATGDLVGAFDLSALRVGVFCAEDSAQGLVFFIGKTVKQYSTRSGYTIEVFDRSTYRLLHTLLVPSLAEAQGEPTRFIRWGNSGLAFLTPSDIFDINPMLFLIDGKFVNSTATPDFTTGLGVNKLPNPIFISPVSAVAGSNDVTVTMTGTDFIPGAQTNWSGVTPQCPAVQTTYVSATELQATIPACDLVSASVATISVSNGTTSSLSGTQFQFTILPAGSNSTVMNLAATSLAWDQKGGLLYAAVGRGDPQYPNSIVAINPATGSVMKNQQVGASPSVVRVTSDGAYLYVGYRNSSSITQLQLPGLNVSLTWPLGTDAISGPITASDIEPAPGAPQTIAVAGSNSAAMVFDNGVVRPNLLESSTSGNALPSLQWGSDATVLYGDGCSPIGDPGDLSIMNVDASGVSQQESFSGALNNSSTPGSLGNIIHYDPGTRFLYVDDGAVVDPTNASFQGGYKSWGFVVPDSSLNTAFVLGVTNNSSSTGPDWANGFGLLSYNKKTFGIIGTFKLPPIPYSGIAGQPVAFVRCGGSCLAFATGAGPRPNSGEAGMLYILNDPGFVTAAP